MNVVLSTLTAFCCLAWIAAALECERSGYCSLGKVEPWVGDILKGESIRAALQARSFRKEIIIASTDKHLVPITMHLDDNVRALGFAHTIFLTSFEEDCSVIMAAMPHGGCAWDSTIQHHKGYGPLQLQWNWRWKFLMRATRLGYNVLSVDLDVLFFNDPYVHFKAPPFADMTVLASNEWKCGLNGGFGYSQNAAPDGPATWLFKEVIERPLRMVDDDMAWISQWSGQEHHSVCISDDQLLLDDALHSTLGDAPSYTNFITACSAPAFSDLPDVERLLRMPSLALGACDKFKHAHSYGVDERQLHPFPARNSFRHGVMHVPRLTEAVWHTRQLNHSLLPPRGRWSEALREQLRDDCPACPQWRDEEGGGRDVVERFSFVPWWLFSNFETCGRDGFWSRSPNNGSEPLQVLGHVHGVVGAHGVEAKYAMKIMYHPPSSFEAIARQRPGGALYLHNRTVDRVLALHPSADLAGLVRSIAELHRVMGGLIQLATLTDRVVAMPLTACNGTWLQIPPGHFIDDDKQRWTEHHPPSPNRVPLYMARGIMPLADDAISPSYACFPVTMTCGECFRDGKALLPVEFNHWRDTLGAAAQPSAANTVLEPGADLLRRLRGWHNSSVAVISQEDVMSALSAAEKEPVIYVGYPMLVEGYEFEKQAGSEFRQRAASCRGLYNSWQYGSDGGLITFVQPQMPRVALAADKGLVLKARRRR